ISSSSLPRRIDSSVLTNSSCASASRVSRSKEFNRRISAGAISRASSKTAADSFFVRFRVYAQIPPPATTAAPPAPASHAPPFPSPPPAPNAASMSAFAEPAQSSVAKGPWPRHTFHQACPAATGHQSARPSSGLLHLRHRPQNSAPFRLLARSRNLPHSSRQSHY